jgi:glycosyltransferase involved in cell wall biosynthesis
MATPLKIAYFIDAMNMGGTESQLELTVNSLDRDRFTPYLYCLKEAENKLDMMPHCQTFQEGVTSFKSPLVWLKMLRAAAWLRRENVDIVQTYFADASLFGATAAVLARRPTLIMCRRDMGNWLSPAERKRFRRLNGLADYFLVNAECIKDSLVRNEGVPEAKIRVLPNMIERRDIEAVNHETRKNARNHLGLNGDFVVGTVANLNRPIKRVDVFIRTAAEVAKKKPSTDFVIIGEGSLRSSLEQLARELGCAEKVHFLGSRPDVPKCLYAFDIAVNSSDSEGLSNAIIEYMAAGLPSVVTDVGGNGEVIGNNLCGAIVSRGDHDAMAAEILRYLDKTNLREEVGRRARQRVEAVYNRSVVIERLMEYYHSVCSLRR